jgi:hemerythrin superfamily protein
MPNALEELASKGAGKVAAATAKLKGLDGVFTTLAEQHQEAATLLKRAVASDSAEKQADLWRTLRRELLSHERAELDVVYPAIEQSGDGSLVRKHAQEAEELEHQIAILDALPYGADDWKAALEQLERLVGSHAHEEENGFFPRAQRLLSKEQNADIEARFKASKQAILESL